MPLWFVYFINISMILITKQHSFFVYQIVRELVIRGLAKKISQYCAYLHFYISCKICNIWKKKLMMIILLMLNFLSKYLFKKIPKSMQHTNKYFESGDLDFHVYRKKCVTGTRTLNSFCNHRAQVCSVSKVG